MKAKSNTRGHTLIELLLYISLSATILMAVSTFFGVVVNVRAKHQNVTEVNDQGLAAMSYMTRVIRNSKSINSPATGSTASTISINTASAVTSPTIFNVNNGTLQVKEGQSSYVAITNNRIKINNLQFTNVSAANTPGSIRVTFSAARSNTSGIQEVRYIYDFEGVASLRPQL